MSVAKNTYELAYIVNAVISDDQIKDIVKKVTAYISESGGEVLDVNEWGSRRLAYPIQKKRNGYYVNMYFRASGSLIARLERAIEIDDNILRYLTLKLDAKMIRFYEANKGAMPEGFASSRDAAAEPKAATAKKVKAEKARRSKSAAVPVEAKASEEEPKGESAAEEKAEDAAEPEKAADADKAVSAADAEKAEGAAEPEKAEGAAEPEKATDAADAEKAESADEAEKEKSANEPENAEAAAEVTAPDEAQTETGTEKAPSAEAETEPVTDEKTEA